MSTKKIRISGKDMKKALIDLDMSYLELSREVGCSVYYIREIAADTRKALVMRKRIARALAEKYRVRSYELPNWAKEAE